MQDHELAAYMHVMWVSAGTSVTESDIVVAGP